MGNSAGVLYFFNLQIVECAEIEIQSKDIGNYSLQKTPDEVHESLDILAAATAKKDSFMIANHKKRRLKVIFVGKSFFKVGSSEVSLLVGTFFGSQWRIVDHASSAPSNYVFAQTNECAVLLFRNGEALGACGVRGAHDAMTSTTRLLQRIYIN